MSNVFLRNSRKVRNILVAATLCAAITAVNALTICSQCGYEQADGANFCTHCGTKLASGGAAPAPDHGDHADNVAAPAPATATQASPASRTLNDLVLETVTEDVRLAREQVEKGAFDVARLLYGNAISVIAIAPAAVTPQQGAHIQKELDRCSGAIGSVLVPCTKCNGTGKGTMRVATLNPGTGNRGGNSNSTLDMPTTRTTDAPCPQCNGAGKVRRNRSMEDIKRVIGASRNRLEVLFRSRGRVPEGNGWIPLDLQKMLTIDAAARFRHAAALPCPTCQGVGRADCPQCKCAGVVDCDHKGCKDGMVEKEQLNTLDKKPLKYRVNCPKCNGTAKIVCAKCNGSGALACPKCNGTTKRDTCAQCGGEGTAQCRLCKGTGHDRDGGECTSCHGVGITFCQQCRGDGYRK